MPFTPLPNHVSLQIESNSVQGLEDDVNQWTLDHPTLDVVDFSNYFGGDYDFALIHTVEKLTG